MTFAQRRNRLTTHFSERIPVVKRRISVIKLFFLQGKAPKEIQTILTETLACVLPGRAKDLSAPL
jgi:hypothetical protein